MPQRPGTTVLEASKIKLLSPQNIPKVLQVTNFTLPQRTKNTYKDSSIEIQCYIYNFNVTL